MKYFFLILLLLPVKPAMAEPSWWSSCKEAFHAFGSRNNPSAARIQEIEKEIQSLLKDNVKTKELEKVRAKLDQLWNERAKNEKGYFTVAMRTKFSDETKQNVQYFTREQRQKLEVKIGKDGSLQRADGSLLSTCERGTKPYGCRPAIFVMDADGKIFLYDGAMQVSGGAFIRHSSLANGLPVASAGEIEVADGRILRLSRKSGHYRPSMGTFLQVVQELRKRGVMLKKVSTSAESLWGVF